MINKNKNLQKIYDPNLNKFIEYGNGNGNGINIYLQNNINKQENISYLIKNPQNFNLAEINKVKINLKENKENYIPFVRIYNYSELNINYIDQILTPPALFSLTLGKIRKDFEVNEDTNEFKICSKMQIRLTTCPSAFDENEIIDLLSKLRNLLDNPLTISL